MCSPRLRSIRVSARRPARRHAFSLVEVVISLGVVSFGLVTLLGLLPSGLSDLRRSMNQTVEAQIVKSIQGDIALRRFTEITAQNLFYDADGNATPNAGDAAYKVDVRTGVPKFPGQPNARDIASSLVNVEIVVQNLRSAAAGNSPKTYAVQVANQGK